jgi:hypothetical protein
LVNLHRWSTCRNSSGCALKVDVLLGVTDALIKLISNENIYIYILLSLQNVLLDSTDLHVKRMLNTRHNVHTTDTTQKTIQG